MIHGQWNYIFKHFLLFAHLYIILIAMHSVHLFNLLVGKFQITPQVKEIVQWTFKYLPPSFNNYQLVTNLVLSVVSLKKIILVKKKLRISHLLNISRLCKPVKLRIAQYCSCQLPKIPFKLFSIFFLKFGFAHLLTLPMLLKNLYCSIPNIRGKTHNSKNLGI